MDARTNQLTASFPSETAKHVYCEFAAASDACYNSINYRRHQAYFSDGESVWDAPVRELREEYVPVIGSGTFDQLERKNADTWESFFELLDAFHDPENQSVTEKPSVPGYWGSRSDGYPLHTLIRNDLYEFEWSDEDFDVVRVNHTVRQPELRTSGHSHTPTGHTNRLEPTSAARFAAIDLGANSTITVVTSAGEAVVCNARSEFERFRSLSERIATLQSQLPTGVCTSRQIRRTYARRGNRRDHHLDATVRLVAEWLNGAGIEHVVVGDLTNVFDTHWHARVNEKTHAFWSHGGLTDRIEDTFEEVGLEWSEESEAGSSSTCPACGSEHVERDGDSFDCLECGYRGHADVVGAANLLVEHTDVSKDELGLMAQPAGHDPERVWRGDMQVTHLKWDDQAWNSSRHGSGREHAGQPSRSDSETNEASADPQVHSAR